MDCRPHDERLRRRIDSGNVSVDLSRVTDPETGVLRRLSYFFRRRPFRSEECEEAATPAMVSPLSREASVGLLSNNPDVVKVADHVVDVRPHAGAFGGIIVYKGSMRITCSTEVI
jgi:hypothetical protein